MAVRSARLSGPILLIATEDPILENPSDSGNTILIKFVTATNVTGTSRALILYRSQGSGATEPIYRTALAGNASIAMEVFWCLEPGEALAASAGVSDAISIIIDGAILDGTAY